RKLARSGVLWVRRIANEIGAQHEANARFETLLEIDPHLPCVPIEQITLPLGIVELIVGGLVAVQLGDGGADKDLALNETSARLFRDTVAVLDDVYSTIQSQIHRDLTDAVSTHHHIVSVRLIRRCAHLFERHPRKLSQR